MSANVMNGVYYEIVGGMSEDIIVNKDRTTMNDGDAIIEAANTERAAYKNTYEQGRRIKSEKLYDPYDDEYFSVGGPEIYHEPLSEDMRFRYSMLSRLKSDCDYFLGNGNGYEGHLWAGSVEKQIKEMRERWESFEEDEKPEWLTMEQIDEYERNMLDVREQIKNLPHGTMNYRIERS